MECPVVFISVDGMTDPLGQSQVIPYLEKLAQHGYRITIISCEKKNNFFKNEAAVRLRLHATGITWQYCLYAQALPVVSQWWNLKRLARMAENIVAAHEGKVLLHCRSYLPALIGVRLKKKSGCLYLFDMRGFWADERREGRIWKSGNPVHRMLYRYFKHREIQLLAEAHHVITLTEKAREIVFGWTSTQKPVTVIPCCTDLELFQRADAATIHSMRARLDISPDALVWGYLGSLGTWYMLEEMLSLFARYRNTNPGTVFAFITPDSRDMIYHAAARLGITADCIRVAAATRSEVPAYVSIFNLGIFFVRPTFSKTGSSPTKMGELLACGVPVLTNEGIGDCDTLIAQTRCGLVIRDFTEASYDAMLNRLPDLLKTPPSDLRSVATQHFALEDGVARYEGVYRLLCQGRLQAERQ